MPHHPASSSAIRSATPRSDSFTYTVADGHGDAATQTVNLTINVPAEPVTAVDQSGTTSEDVVLTKTAATGLLAGASSDADDPISVTQINGSAITNGQTIALASGATLTIHTDGSYSYDASTTPASVRDRPGRQHRVPTVSPTRLRTATAMPPPRPST